MITCPACQNQAFVGTFFCFDCGRALVDFPERTVEVQEQGPAPAPPESLLYDGSELDSLRPDALFGLRVMPAGDVISLQGRENFTLGQAVSGQAVVPDIDLSGFNAEAHGVSRIHAELRLEGPLLFAIDLDSSNGTQVNGLYIEPQEPTRLHHGDMLQLGTLQLQLLIRNQT